MATLKRSVTSGYSFGDTFTAIVMDTSLQELCSAMALGSKHLRDPKQNP